MDMFIDILKRRTVVFGYQQISGYVYTATINYRVMPGRIISRTYCATLDRKECRFFETCGSINRSYN